MLDIRRHLVSVYWLGLTEIYGNYPHKSIQAGFMPKELSDGLSKLIGIGDILMRKYSEINVNILHDNAKEIIDRIFRSSLSEYGSSFTAIKEA